MTKQHGPVSFASPALHSVVSADTARFAFAVLGIAAAVTFGTDTSVLARESTRGRAPATAGRDAKATASSCALTRFTSGRVKAVIDGRTFVFDDGREVRLAAIEVAPLAPPGEERRGRSIGPDRNHSPAGETARLALAALTGGREVVLKQGEAKAPPIDRYGRLVAFAFAADGATERSLQDALLTSGHARLSTRIEPRGCLPGLRRHEDQARRALLGLWGDPLYSARAAERPADILPQRGRFAVVEGTVVSVRESGGTIYVNFSRRWSDGFSAFILKRNAARFPAAGLDLKRLKDRRIEVRGFVEQRRGPGITIERPEQIAIIEAR
ncbi:MAG: thermonuclease family protein [Xanthobacteraceae bacterium]